MVQEFDECLKLIDQVLEESNNLCEYALFTKALIKRHRGAVLAAHMGAYMRFRARAAQSLRKFMHMPPYHHIALPPTCLQAKYRSRCKYFSRPRQSIRTT